MLSQAIISSAVLAIRDFIDQRRPYNLFSAEEAIGFAFALLNREAYSCQKMFLREDLGNFAHVTISLHIDETSETVYLTYRIAGVLDTSYTQMLNQEVFHATQGILGKLPVTVK